MKKLTVVQMNTLYFEYEDLNEERSSFFPQGTDWISWKKRQDEIEDRMAEISSLLEKNGFWKEV